jgi:hypothetical protein
MVLGFTSVKAVSRMLMKLTPSVKPYRYKESVANECTTALNERYKNNENNKYHFKSMI